MPRYAQLVMGPAASGKSSYCSIMEKHCQAMRRSGVKFVNLDPAAEEFSYTISGDVRELIAVDDVMEDKDLRFGPNGGLVFCMQYLVDHLDWFSDTLGEDDDDDYVFFDCPGQIELYTHTTIFRQIIAQLQKLNFQICAVFLLDAQFLVEPTKFIAGMLAALSAMVNLELPHVNVLTKVDLLNTEAKKAIENFTDPHAASLVSDSQPFGDKYKQLTKAIASLLDSYSLINFVPLDPSDEDSIDSVMVYVDGAIHYGEDQEPHEFMDEQANGGSDIADDERSR